MNCELSTFPIAEGQRVSYAASIDMANAQLSGMAVLLREGQTVRGSLFNEFGITAIDFIYYPGRNKVKLNYVIAMMDKWYIRRVLRKDLARLMTCLQGGNTHYRNERRHIAYQLTPIPTEL